MSFFTDKIKCYGVFNNWKVFFRTPDSEKKLRSFTFRIKSPLIPPEITEDNVDFTPKDVDKVKGFPHDFSYFVRESITANITKFD